LNAANIFFTSVKKSILDLSPRVQFKNPALFITYLGAILTTLYTVHEIVQASISWLHVQIAFWLWFTVIFANFAQSLAEVRGKAQADSLREMQRETHARQLLNGKEVRVAASSLKKGAIIVCEAGDIIPADGEVIEGIATVDESAITGESAPVIRESGGDRNAVTAGTKVLSDRIKIQVTAEVGNSFLDRIIHLIEGAKRQKTPNEIALTIVLSTQTLISLLVVASIKFFTSYSAHQSRQHLEESITLPVLTSLLVCLIPTTIGALLNAIGIAGIDRMIRSNVIATSGRAVEAAGDVDVLILDKTGTITLGNRMAVQFVPVAGVEAKELAKISQLASLADETPEGRSIVVLAKTQFELRAESVDTTNVKFIPFSAQTRMSGVDVLDTSGNVVSYIRKGAVDAIANYVEKRGGVLPFALRAEVEKISYQGGTPLLVSEDKKILGAIYLKDVMKGGIKERFNWLRKMGVRTIMVTGDNPLTAAAIAAEAGVDDFLAEARPESKLERIKFEQQKGHLVAMAGDGTNDAPALAQADVGVAMNTGTQASREAGNMVDLDSKPTKLIEIIEVGKQLLMTRGSLTTFSIANDIAKYFAILPAIFGTLYLDAHDKAGPLAFLNLMKLHSPESAVLSAVIFNALIIVALTPLALRGIRYHAESAYELLAKNIAIYGLGGIIAPFVGIKLIDMFLYFLRWA
jgi:K+-transporting ATPase ATPase B chain